MTATNAVPVDSSNIEQLRAWDGDEGDYWADHAEYFDRSVAAYHQRLLDAAAIGDARPSARCRLRDRSDHPGRGPRRVAPAPRSGVDLSSRMLDHARRRAAEEGVANATFAQADAQIHPFEPGVVRRGHQPHRGDVLRRPRRRVPQHRARPASRADDWCS